MTDKHYTDKSESANQATNNATIAVVRAEQSELGALDLEYPEAGGLYGEVFERYLPEIADRLIDTRAVRMLVEAEFNCRRVQRMFDSLVIDGDARIAVELVRRDIEALIWYVCDTLSEMYRRQWGYETPGAAHEWAE